HGGRKRRKFAQRERAQEPGSDADSSADDTLHDALDHELLHDVPARGADRAAHADLLGALSDADQHHVHDHDAADNRGNRADHQEDREERRADLLPQRDVAFRSADEEIVVLTGKDVPAGAKHATGIVLRKDKIGVRSLGLDADGETVALSTIFEKSTQRDDDEVVLIAPEDAADLLECADHGVLGAAGTDHFAERAGLREEVAHHAVADQTDFHRVHVLDLAEIAACLDGARVDI